MNVKVSNNILIIANNNKSVKPFTKFIGKDKLKLTVEEIEQILKSNKIIHLDYKKLGDMVKGYKHYIRFSKINKMEFDKYGMIDIVNPIDQNRFMDLIHRINREVQVVVMSEELLRLLHEYDKFTLLRKKIVIVTK